MRPSALSWRAALPLFAFALLYLVAVIAAGTWWLRFTWTPAFWLMLAAPWFWWMQLAGGSGLRGWRGHVALQVRLWLVGLFVVLLAEPRAVRKSDALSVVYALDVSDSMGQEVSDRSLAWIAESVKRKPEKDEAGLVVFGREAAVELPPRQTLPLDTLSAIVPKDASDLAKGLRIASAVLPEGNPSRIVLISDGNQTEGEVLPALDELKARGVAVDVVRVNFDFEKEAWLERLDLPRTVKRGETYEAAVLLSALSAGRGKLRLAENGETIVEKEIEYAAGKNRFAVPLPQRGPGLYEYVATLTVPKSEDAWAENNVAIGHLYLKGEGHILVATDVHSDSREWEGLVAALKDSERAVNVRMSHAMPRDTLSLLPYDLIVLPNAPAAAFDAVQLQAMRDAVFNLGTGLLMLGSEHTFGPGGYRHTPIESALPVEMDVTQKKVLPSGALLIALDCSGSMAMEVAGRSKISLANRGAVLALKTLNPQDHFGVLAVDTLAHAVVPMGQHGALSEANTQKILGIRAGGGGIFVYTALAQAALSFRNVNTNIKHVILFADANDAEQQVGASGSTALGLAAEMAATKITISVVALGEEHDRHATFLRTLAAAGQGRFYLTNDATTLPQIFIKEAITLKRTMLQNRTFVPEAVFPSPVLKGIDTLPPLHGYVLATPKAKANVILQAPPLPEQAAGGDLPDPVFATWRYGLGTTAAWTSDLAPNWARDWMEWDKFRPFVKQLVTEISRVERHSDLALSTSATGSLGSVTIEDYAPGTRFVDLTARVFGPRGESRDVPLEQIAPRRYHAQFPLWGKGRYQVAVAGAGGEGAGEQAFGGFVVPYSPEYLRFKSDPILLEQIARRTGGRVLTADDIDLFHPPREVRESSRPVFDWFLLVLACLVPIDVAVRRVQLDWAAIAAWFRRGEKRESTATMGALLERKKLAHAAPPPPVERPRPIVLPPRPAAPPAAPVEAPAPDTAEPPQSTTGRLLARKRLRQASHDEGQPPAS